MIKRIIFFSSFILLFASCNSYKNKKECTVCKIEPNVFVKDRKLINFKHIKDFGVNYKGKKNYFFYVQTFYENNKLNVIFNSSQEEKLVFIDIEGKTVKEKKLKKNSSFFRLNKDSLFYLFSPSHRKGGNCDSTLVLMNETGKILKYYNYRDAHVRNSENLPDLDKQIADFFSDKPIIHNEKDDSLLFLNTDFAHPLVYEKNKLFLTFSRSTTGCPYCLGGKDFLKVELPFVGYVDLQKNKFIGLNKIKYPYLTDSTYYPSGYDMIHIISLQNNKEILVSFEYTPLVYKYNFLTDSLVKINGFKSVFKDSIYASKNKPGTSNKIQRYSYYHIFYDKKNNRYIRNFGFPLKKGLSSLIFADSLFNVTAEGITPKDCGFITAISKDTLLFYNFEKSKNYTDSIYFSLFTVDEKPGLTQKVYSEQKDINKKIYDIKDYVNKIIQTKEKNYAVVIIPIDFSCPGCVEETLHFFSNNLKKISEIPVYMVISTYNDDLTKERLEKYNLNNKPTTVFIDSSKNYFDYHPVNKEFNPQLILFENNKVTHNKIYNARKIRKLQTDLFDFLLKYKYIKGYYKKNKND